MFQYKCLNPISACGTSLFTEEYKQVRITGGRCRISKKCCYA